MKVLYVAGPYRARGDHYVWENILSARSVARQAWLKGWAVICPHANTFLMDGPDINPEQFLAGDLEFIERCDAVLMLPRWEQSVGATGEKKHAECLAIPVYYSIDELPEGKR